MKLNSKIKENDWVLLYNEFSVWADKPTLAKILQISECRTEIGFQYDNNTIGSLNIEPYHKEKSIVKYNPTISNLNIFKRVYGIEFKNPQIKLFMELDSIFGKEKVKYVEIDNGGYKISKNKNGLQFDLVYKIPSESTKLNSYCNFKVKNASDILFNSFIEMNSNTFSEKLLYAKRTLGSYVCPNFLYEKLGEISNKEILELNRIYSFSFIENPPDIYLYKLISVDLKNNTYKFKSIYPAPGLNSEFDISFAQMWHKRDNSLDNFRDLNAKDFLSLENPENILDSGIKKLHDTLKTGIYLKHKDSEKISILRVDSETGTVVHCATLFSPVNSKELSPAFPKNVDLNYLIQYYDFFSEKEMLEIIPDYFLQKQLNSEYDMEKQSYSYYLDSEFLPKVFEYSEDYGYQILCQDCKINTGEVSYNLSDLVTETPESNFILNTILTSAGILFLEKFVSWGQKKLNPTNPTKELK